jgi:hypothetical protein
VAWSVGFVVATAGPQFFRGGVARVVVYDAFR